MSNVCVCILRKSYSYAYDSVDVTVLEDETVMLRGGLVTTSVIGCVAYFHNHGVCLSLNGIAEGKEE